VAWASPAVYARSSTRDANAVEGPASERVGRFASGPAAGTLSRWNGRLIRETTCPMACSPLPSQPKMRLLRP
jgi:hypothetical protein